MTMKHKIACREQQVIIHKIEHHDPNIYCYPFIYRGCDGPKNLGSPKGLLTFNWKKVTCKKCLSLR